MLKRVFTSLCLGSALLVCLSGCPDSNPRVVDLTNYETNDLRVRELEHRVFEAGGVDIITTASQVKLCHFKFTYNEEKENSDLHVIVGPNTHVKYDKNASYIDLYQGWVYVWGRYPRVRRGRVHAGAEGSIMAVWSGDENGIVVDRVFYVSGVSASWKLDAGGQSNSNVLWNYYQEFKDPNQTPNGGWQQVNGGTPEAQLDAMKKWRSEFPY